MSQAVLTPTPPSGGSPTTAGHPVDEVLPADRLFTLGLQHLFIMYAGAVAVPLIVGPAVGLNKTDIGILIGADLLISGICTIVQSAGVGKLFGVRLPVVAGATFTVLSPMIAIANSFKSVGGHGLPAVYGAMMVSGVFGLLIAKPFSMVLRFFPPLVTGTVIAMIGLSLIGADIGLIAGNDRTAASFGAESHIALAGFVILMIVVVTRVFTGFVSQIAVLVAIALGTLVAWPMGLLDFSSVGGASWFGGPKIFHFGAPVFKFSAIISMCIVILVTYTESTADMLAVGEMVEKDLSPDDLARGLRTDGLSALLASFTNSFPDTAYAENVGIVGMTGVRSRWVVTVCGVLLVILGLIPKMGEVIANVPGPVIGGAATVMFAMVTAIGIRTLHKVDFEGNHNLLIIAVSLSVGLIPAFAPTFYEKFPKNFQVIFGSSITSTVIIVFVLNLVFNHWVRTPPRRGLIKTALEHGAVSPATEGIPGGAAAVAPPAGEDGRGGGPAPGAPPPRPLAAD